MTTRVLNCSVDIGGVDFSSYVRSISREHFICRPVGTATISVDPDNAPACTPGSAVSISEMGTQRFTGVVSEVSKSHMPPTYEIECQDELKKLAEYNFVDTAIVANGETITYWIHYFLDKVGIANRVVAETPDTVPPGIEFHLESCMDIVKKLCNTQGWQMYADANGTVHIGDFLIPGTPTNISNPTRVMDSSDDSWLRNNVTVFGYGNVKGEVTATIPELHDETRSTVLANPYIRTQEQAQAIASQMMGYFDTPLDTKEIAMEGGERASFLLETVAAGDPYVLGVSGQVTGLETSFAQDGYIQTHYLNERCPGFWALGSGSPTGGSCFVGHKSAGVYRYDYRNDVAVARNTGLSGTALQCHDLKVDPHFYGDGRRRVWRVTAGGVYKSYNDAGTWQAVSFPNPVNTSGDSPAPTVADLTFYGMAFDKTMRGVVHVLAGYTSPNDRLWLYTSDTYGIDWTSKALHWHCSLDWGGWSRMFSNADIGEDQIRGFVYAPYITGHFYISTWTAGVTNVIKVWDYDGTNPPVSVLTINEPGWTAGTALPSPSGDLVVTNDGRIWVLATYQRTGGGLAKYKVVGYVSTNGINWTKALDTYDGLGIGEIWNDGDAAATISFETVGGIIRDSEGRLATFETGETVIIEGSLWNDGALTITDGGHEGWMAVLQVLVNEGAGTPIHLKKRWNGATMYGAINIGSTLLISITDDHFYDPIILISPPFERSYIVGYLSIADFPWSLDLVGVDLPDQPTSFAALGKTGISWYVTRNAELAWTRSVSATAQKTYHRRGAGDWIYRGPATITWGSGGGYYTYSYEDHLYAVDMVTRNLYRSTNGTDWELVDDTLTHGNLGVYEERFYSACDNWIYAQAWHNLFEKDEGSSTGIVDSLKPRRFIEAFDGITDQFWYNELRGVYKRIDALPGLRTNLRRSAMANQGHQYSVDTLPNVPWITYVAAARESGGDEYIRLLRIYTRTYGSQMSHSFSSGSVLGRPGFIRVSAPPRSGSCVDEVAYAFGRGYETPGDPLSNEMVWRFESGQLPADKTDVTWPGYIGDAIQSLLHDGDDQDWVALFNKGAARGTQDGGDNWNDLTDVTILTDGADRVGNEIVAGRYSSGSIMIRYSNDRALHWNSQGDGISTADGIASVQMYDKTRLP